MKNDTTQLTTEEQQYEKEIANGEWIVDPNSNAVIKQFEAAAKKGIER